MIEEWRAVPGYDGWYEVSNQGRVRSWKNGKWGRSESPRLMNPQPMRQGYPRVSLQIDRKTSYRLVHHLVLEAFVGSRPRGMEAAHWDGDRMNATLTNLRWATPRENAEDKTRHGTHRNKFTGPLDRSSSPPLRLRGSPG